jgi:5,10-methylenetetrahydromethanopterin reductase
MFRWVREELAAALLRGASPQLGPDEDGGAALRALAAEVPDPGELAGRLPDEVVDRLAVIGEPADCARAAWRLHQAGADAVVLVPPPRAEIAIGQLERAAPEVLRRARPSVGVNEG